MDPGRDDRSTPSATPYQDVIAAIDAAASYYNATQFAQLGAIAMNRITHHELRMIPVVGSIGTPP
jgi:hypothetical protein